MCYLYLQSSSASRHPKISNLMFFVNPVYRAWSHPNAWHLKNFSMTRLDMVHKELHISLWSIPMFRWKIFYLHLQSSSAPRKWKNSNVAVSLTLYTECEEIQAWHLVKQLTIYVQDGSWKRRFLKVFCDLGISCYRKLGRNARWMKVGHGPFNLIEIFRPRCN